MTGEFDIFSRLKFSDPVSRKDAAAMSTVDRQHQINTLIIQYPLFNKTIAAIQNFHRPVDGGTHDTGKIAGLLGLSRAGKSWAAKWYADSLGNQSTATTIAPKVLYVDVIEGSNSHDFASSMFNKLGLRSIPRRTAQSILDSAADEISSLGVELVIIDDAQFLLGSHYRKTVKDAFGFIVSVAERNTCNVILAGTQDIHFAMSHHPHAMNRGSFPHKIIEPYNWLERDQRKNFLFLLDAIDQRLPFLESSNLADPSIAAHFYRVSQGLIGIVMNYVSAAAFIAMNQKSASVTIDHLKEAGAMRRAVNDPYVPFLTSVDMEDPIGERRKNDEALLLEAKSTLSKSRSKKVFS